MLKQLRTSSFFGINLAAAIIFLILLGMTWFVVSQWRSNQIELDLEQRASEFSRISQENLIDSVENLRSVASLLTSFELVHFRQFKNFAQHILTEDTGLLFIEWQPLVKGAERDQFVRLARSLGLPDFELWEPGKDGEPTAAAIREEHVPVMFMLSRTTAIDTTGIDLAWSVERMESKWLSRDTGRPQSSGLFKVVTGRNGDYAPVGFAITLPIYQDGLIPETTQQRQMRLVGYLAGVYALEDVLKEPIETYIEKGVNLTIDDRIEPSPDLTINETSGTGPTRTSTLTFFGQTWDVSLTASKSFLQENLGYVGYALPLVLVLFAAVILLFLKLLENKNNALTGAYGELSDALHRVRESERQLRDLARRDELTGLLNRREFSSRLEIEVIRVERHNLSCALLMMDLDHFKQINDSYGHPIGDKVLQQFAREVTSVSRRIDSAARVGGEEFALLLPHVDSTQAASVAQRLRTHVEQSKLELDSGQYIQYTVSIGIAMCTPGISAGKLIGQADDALYQAKHQGRNCVQIHPFE